MEKIANGIYKFRLGTPEKITPITVLNPTMSDGLNTLSDKACPFGEDDIKISFGSGYCTVEIPLYEDEDVYGLGLQLKSFRQSGHKKTVRVNSDPATDLGDSHGPVPFYVTTRGTGIFIDTSRFATFYFGGTKRKNSVQETEGYKSVPNEEEHHFEHKAHSGNVFVKIPSAQGADIYVFVGDSLKDAVARYNLFSGGGCFPPLWGLGILYRADWHANQEDIIRLGRTMREDKIPCDIFGIEPGWQTNAYSCSFVWDSGRFPSPKKMCEDMKKMGFRMNLWEHCYTHPSSPIYDRLYPLSGDSYVWDGIVPDFTLKDAADTFSDHHAKFVDEGISGFKLDECDSGDYILTGNWGFPEFTKFPGGMDGEQMRSELGLLYQRTMLKPFCDKNQRVYGQARASHALAAPFPYVLYSDLYNHTDFVRGVATAAFGGVLWSPEVRQTDSEEELIRRLQAVIFSPLAVINAWMIPSPPWKQYNYDKNHAGEMLPDADRLTSVCRDIFNLRMSLVPYLYSAYLKYNRKGIPPFRPLVMDCPEDLQTRNIWDELIVGDNLLFAPMVYGCGSERDVYLPEGKWHNFFTGEQYEGKAYYHFKPKTEEIILFVKDNSLIPIAEPVLHCDADTCFKIEFRLYGDHGETELVTDDGTTFDYITCPPSVMKIRADANGISGFVQNFRYKMQ